MQDVNCVVLTGHLGNGGNLRYTQTGAPVLSLRLAVGSQWKDKAGARKDRTDWTSCAVFGARAEALAKIVQKGQRVAIEGSIRERSYKAQDGSDRHTMEIRVRNLTFLTPPRAVAAADGAVAPAPEGVPADLVEAVASGAAIPCDEDDAPATDGPSF